MSELRKAYLLFFLIPFLLGIPLGRAQAPSSEEVSARLRAIEERLRKIEAAQKELTERQDEILEAVVNLRSWIRAN